ncbi:hypothetical protein BLOT_008080 [Blomia tropicalis]|nr:hypothetical protein BLOT_008080 [Blomia tropicalis]
MKLILVLMIIAVSAANPHFVKHPIFLKSGKPRLFEHEHLIGAKIVQATSGDELVKPLKHFVSKLNQMENLKYVNVCYDSQLNGKHISLFELNVLASDVVWDYYIAMKNREPTNTSITALLGSINTIVGYVAECGKRNQTNSMKMGLTAMSDISDHEMKKINGYKPLNDCPQFNIYDSLPEKIDYRKIGVVTPVRNQKRCGSCWAFTITDSVASLMLLKQYSNDTQLDLSVQQLIDHDQHSLGCNGGTSDSFKYVQRYGLTSSKYYPYLGRKSMKNETKSSYPIVAQIKAHCTLSYQWLLPDRLIMQALVHQGPLYIVMHGEGPNLRNYKSGIIDGTNCSKEPNHAVLLVGYDHESWILKNSWGPHWGESGFFRVQRGNNACGINTEVAFPIV